MANLLDIAKSLEEDYKKANAIIQEMKKTALEVRKIIETPISSEPKKK